MGKVVFGMNMLTDEDVFPTFLPEVKVNFWYGELPPCPALAQSQPPAPLYPLQRMSSQPSAFGQSMWKPWENVK